jgi:glutamate/tyrosine decarboxylase-like PLP-dependent enzyme
MALTAIREKLKQLQQSSAVLERSSRDRAVGLQKAGAHSERFLESLQSRAMNSDPGSQEDAMRAFAFGDAPDTLDNALQALENHVDSVGHNLGSSRFFAYIPSGGLYESALADYLAAVSNRYAGVGAAAPGATRMEDAMLRWLAGVVGYPASAEGDLTSGGSMAALSAIVAAREACELNSARVTTAVVYQTTHTHHTFRKALHVAGLGECVVRDVAVDAVLRMDPVALRACVEKDRAAGLHPWLIAATAGTTDAGAVDPLHAIADIAAQYSLWMHVDAAYGGAFALCNEGRQRLSGIERSDSLVLDPHKGFFLPCGIGVVLVRDGKKLYDAYHARGIYMQDVAGDSERSPCDYSAELTRPFRALRFWLPFKVHGSQVFAAALEEKLLLAQYFHTEVTKIPGIEVGPEPDLSIVTFQYRSGSSDSNVASKALLDAIHKDARVFLTSTTIAGQFTIRMAILTHTTHLDDVDLALQVIRECTMTVDSKLGARRA